MKSFFDLGSCRSARMDNLGQQVDGAHNGACDQVWKEGHEECEVSKAFRGSQVPSVHIDGVTHRLKRKKRYSDDERNIEGR